MQVLYIRKIKSPLFLHYYENFHRVIDSFLKYFDLLLLCVYVYDVGGHMHLDMCVEIRG